MTALPRLIVPETVLIDASASVDACVAEHGTRYAIDSSDPYFGRAFAYYLFFTEGRAIGAQLDRELDEEARFYNAYFWFQRFVKLHTDVHGFDCGLEQQAFQMLEHADFEFALDLTLIETLDEAARG